MLDKEILGGIHLVMAVLENRPQTIDKIWIQKERQDHRVQKVIELAKQQRVTVQLLSKKEWENLSLDYYQGVAAQCHATPAYSERDLAKLLESLKPPYLLLILDCVQDPHNVGACLRNANALGTQAVIVPKDKSAGLTPTVRKIACGAAEVTPFVVVSNLARALAFLKDEGVWLVGLDEEASQVLSEVDLKGNIGLVMGGEGEGLRRLTRETCDYLAKIPMSGTVESLNVSAASAIALYEVVRQRE